MYIRGSRSIAKVAICWPCAGQLFAFQLQELPRSNDAVGPGKKSALPLHWVYVSDGFMMVYDLEWSSWSIFNPIHRYHVPCSTSLNATTCYLQICSGPAHMDSLVLSLCWSLAPGKDERLQSWKCMTWKSGLHFCRWNYYETQDCDMISLLCRLPVSSLQPGRSENGVPTNDIAEDEDLLNVALWQRGSKWSARSTPHK